jgi:signal transduction histidine kinase
MQIKKRLRINNAVSIFAIVVVIALLVTALFSFKSAFEISNIADEILSSIYMRSELRYDYLRNASERAKKQWLDEHEQIGKLLALASERFTDIEEKMIVNEMISGHESVRKIFLRIVENREKAGPAASLDASSKEFEDRLLNQLTIRRYMAIFNARRLQDASDRHLYSVLGLAGWGIVCVIAILAAATIVNSWMMGRTITSRIRMLQEGASIIGEGNLVHRIDIKGKDEFVDLSAAFNAMTAKLRLSHLRLEKEVDERKRAEEEVIKLNDDLRHSVRQLVEANKELEAFSYSVSHDLRSPLRSIDGFSLALLEDYAGGLGAEGRDYLERVRNATKRMAQLIDDLLNLSRMSRMEMRREKVDLSALARDIAGRLVKHHPDRVAEFIISDGLTTFGDERLLMVMLENLVANAWKFSEKGPRSVIEFGATLQDGKEVFFVKDNGAGFDMTYANRLFTPFQRLHLEAEFPGSGIGLATVKRIINRHGGRVWIEGDVGKGATVYFTL